MFDAIASEVQAALMAALEGATSDHWTRIRQRCKDVIVFLESCGQIALAARIQQDYERLKQAWLSADPRTGLNGQVADAGQELCATLVSLAALGLNTDGRRKRKGASALATGDSELGSPAFKHSSWPGSDRWENWGVGLVPDGSWQLYHFHRTTGAWVRHRHATLIIPTGIAHALANKFIRFGFLNIKDAHGILLEHASGGISAEIHEDEVIAKIKSPMSRLRAAIREAAEREGHTPKGMPIMAPTRRPRNWRARARFGMAEKRGDRSYQLLIHY